jgi:hypothetical protein
MTCIAAAAKGRRDEECLAAVGVELQPHVTTCLIMTRKKKKKEKKNRHTDTEAIRQRWSPPGDQAGVVQLESLV